MKIDKVFGDSWDQIKDRARKAAGVPDGIVRTEDLKLHPAGGVPGNRDNNFWYANVIVSELGEDSPYTLEELARAWGDIRPGGTAIRRADLEKIFTQAHKNRVFGKEPRRTNYKASL